MLANHRFALLGLALLAGCQSSREEHVAGVGAFDKRSDERISTQDATSQTNLPGGPIRGAFFALSVRDAKTMAAWYREQLGFRTLLQRDLPERGIVAVLLERDGSMIELIQRSDTSPAPLTAEGKRNAIAVHGAFKIGLAVTDLQQLHDRLESAGVAFDHHIVQPDGNPWKTFAIRDPEGNILQFFG